VFWTRIGFETLGRRFSRHAQAELERLGAKYGEGLQLVNILRDLPRDLSDGRCYLPVGPGAEPETMLVAAADWRERAREGLECGLSYGSRVCSWRLRCATVLPALIGLPTLDLLDRADWNALGEGVKVDRRTVRRAVREALCFPRE
jgi:farnesyl-diphosphate farnesyltransferase